MEALVITDLIDLVVSSEPKIQRYGECENINAILYKVFGSLNADFIFAFNDLNLYEKYAVVYFSACQIASQYANKGVRNLDRLVGCIRRAMKQGVYKHIGWCWLPDWYREVERCSSALEDANMRPVYTLEQCEEFYATIQKGESLTDPVEYVYNSKARVEYYYKVMKDRSDYLITSIRVKRK